MRGSWWYKFEGMFEFGVFFFAYLKKDIEDEISFISEIDMKEERVKM